MAKDCKIDGMAVIWEARTGRKLKHRVRMLKERAARFMNEPRYRLILKKRKMKMDYVGYCEGVYVYDEPMTVSFKDNIVAFGIYNKGWNARMGDVPAIFDDPAEFIDDYELAWASS